MLLIGTKVDNNPTSANGIVDAVIEWNPFAFEIMQIVETTGQTLATGITNQLSKSMWVYGVSSSTFLENSPSANAANLTPWTGNNSGSVGGVLFQQSLQVLTSSDGTGGYSAMHGAIIEFYHTIVSTASSLTGFSVNIGQSTGTYIGSLYLKQIGGSLAIPIGAVYGYTVIRLNYNGGSPFWELIQSQGYTQYQAQNQTNYCINGTGQVCLNGATSWASAAIPISSTLGANYLWSKWRENCTFMGTVTMSASQQALAPGTADELVLINAGATYYMRIGAIGPGSGFAAGDYSNINQWITNGAVLLGGGRSMTITFWARATTAGKKLGICAQQYYGTGGSPSANTVIQGQIITLGTTFTQYSITLTTVSLNGITPGTNNDNAMILMFLDMWNNTSGSAYLNSATSESFSPSGACNVDITAVTVASGVIPLNFYPIPLTTELNQCLAQNQIQSGIEYIAGNTYNSVALTVSNSSGTPSLIRGVFLVSQSADGTWWLDIKINYFAGTGWGSTSYTITIAGITFQATANNYQTIAVWADSANLADAYCTPNSNTIIVYQQGLTLHGSVSGKVELASKPTWVYLQ